MFENSKWIWAEDNSRVGDRVFFRKTFALERAPKSAVMYVAASDSYSLYVNGKPVILMGGLPRSNSESGNYDQCDIGAYLSKGENVIGFKCYFFGEDSIVGVTCGAAGLIAECLEIGFNTDSKVQAYRPEGFGKAAACTYPDSSVSFDSGKSSDLSKAFETTFGSTLFSDAFEFGGIGSQPYGEIFARELPNFAFDNVAKAKITEKVLVGSNTVYTAEIGEAAIFAPIIEVTALGAETITVVSDRFESDGGFGDSEVYTNGKVTYVCRNGAQSYESDVFLSGTGMKITAPNGVKVNAIGYRKLYYGAEIIGNFGTGDKRVDKLVEKSLQTLETCIITDIWDSPDRDRGVKLAAMSAAARAALYLYDDNILPLIKRSILAFTEVGEGFCNNAVSPQPVRNQYDALLTLGELGAIKAYYDRTGDKKLLGSLMKKAALYLLDFKAEDGDIDFEDCICDGGYNVDNKLILTALYYSACKFISAAAKAEQNEVLSAKLSERAKAIADVFESRFFKDAGYSGAEFYDDRANAFVVLTGLAKLENYGALVSILKNVKCATAQTEPFVFEALVKLGAGKAALSRLLESYSSVYNSDNPTMPECFGESGAKNYSGSIGLLAALFAAVGGVKTESGEFVSLKPDMCGLSDLRFTAAVNGGTIHGACRTSKNEIIVENNSLLKVTLTAGDKINVLSKGKSRNSI